MPTTNIRFCGYPSAFIFDCSEPKTSKNRLKHLFWGDTIIVGNEHWGDYVRASSRDVEGWMKESELLTDPLLDIIFLDVGQGDSCLVVTPADEKIIVDAGEEDNLLRYLRWRYRNYETAEMRVMGGRIKAVVISHPDVDHYRGLRYLLEDPNFGPYIEFEAVYHNGIFVREGKGLAELGTLVKEGKIKYLTDPVVTRPDLEAFFANALGWQNKEYPSLIYKILTRKSNTEIQMLHQKSAGIPNLTSVPGLSVKILGPILEEKDGQGRLRTFAGDPAQTKNGHSVILLVQYKNIKILLGGDLNIPSEKFLLGWYAGNNADRPFQADVLKAYHHGSGDFSEEFIKAIGPYVSVVSSGDNESYSHPRADTMGFLGKASRGLRPLIFSTELARSSREIVKNPNVLKKELKDLKDNLKRTDLAAAEREKTEQRLDKLENSLINRSVSVYGAINLRTDGQKLLMCQKKEAPNKEREEWDIYRIEPDPGTNELKFISGK
jgi:beta-lactamase superfamily II metal-dependent hydrolase